MPTKPTVTLGRGAWPLGAALAGILLMGLPVRAIEFAEADIFFELNATARDLGVHVSLDADNWRELRIRRPDGQQLIQISPRGSLAQIGLTELFFEGAEPSLLQVPFSRFLSRVPAGVYTFLGTTTEGQSLHSSDRLTTDIPCPVAVLTPQPDEPVEVGEVVVSWRAAPGVYNPDTRRCNTARDVGLVGYQLIVEVVNEARDFVRHLAIDLPPGQRQLHIPTGFLLQGARLPGTEFKLEVLAIEDSGNKTITEGEFEVEAGAGD
jgi:hypothetical protein